MEVIVIENNDNLDLRLIVELSHMYYNGGATQQEIANRYAISRSLVSKYLNIAREIGLVEVIIHDEKVHPYRETELSLVDKYSLREVICVDDNGNLDTLTNSLGIAASRCLLRIAKPGDDIGVSAGSTLLRMAKNLSPFTNLEDTTFVPLAGGLATDYKDIHSHVICDILAKASHSKKVELFAPILLDSVESKEVFLKQPFISDVLKRAKNVDIAFIGAGERPNEERITTSHDEKLKSIASDKNLQEKLSGDISYLFVDENGKEIPSDWNDRLLGITLEDLKTIDTVVLVAGGKHKEEIIRSACRSGIVDILITDVGVANSLVKEDKE